MADDATEGPSLLDSLLGRAGLRERIDELETELATVREERDSLERRLDAESERRADAVTARQDAEERVNRLEDRVAQLEGELERERDDDAGDLDFRGVERLGPREVESLLDTLESVATGPEGALTATVGVAETGGGAPDLPDAVESAFGERARLLTRAAPCVAVTDDHGVVSAALSPPVPPSPRVEWSDGFALERSNYVPTGEYTLAVVRADVFAVGEYDGRERVAAESVRTEVKSDHSKGGFSQSRFERLRDEQIEAHLDRCREALAGRDHGPLYLVGDRAAVDALAETEAPAATAAVDATGDPEDALDAAFEAFWTTRLSLV